MIAFFEARAWWFVALAWILCPVALVFGLATLAGAGISLTYFPTNPNAWMDRLHQKMAYVLMALSFGVALASSILLAETYRRATIAVVVGGWGAFAVGLTLVTMLAKPGE